MIHQIRTQHQHTRAVATELHRQHHSLPCITTSIVTITTTTSLHEARYSNQTTIIHGQAPQQSENGETLPACRQAASEPRASCSLAGRSPTPHQNHIHFKTAPLAMARPHARQATRLYAAPACCLKPALVL